MVGVRWEKLALHIGEAVAADIIASVTLGLGWRDLAIHAGIAALGVVRGFFADWRRSIPGPTRSGHGMGGSGNGARQPKIASVVTPPRSEIAVRIEGGKRDSTDT